MGFTYIRKCTMACWTGGEKQGMGVKSILAFLLRLGHALHRSGEGNIFLTERETGLKKKSSLFHLENKEDAHRAGERGWGRRFPVEGQIWGVVYGCRWLSCRDQLGFNQKITNGNPTLLLQLEEWSPILGRSKRGMGIGQGEISA